MQSIEKISMWDVFSSICPDQAWLHERMLTHSTGPHDLTSGLKGLSGKLDIK